jgi:hypothetical protein
MMTELFKTGIEKGAQFSDDRRYRWALWRTWDADDGHVMFVGLNPSIANENQDDPTVRRCIGFAKRWGYGGIYMMNLFGFCSTDPKGMQNQDEPVGEENNQMLFMYAQRAEKVIAAWGDFGCAVKRGHEVEGLITVGTASIIARHKKLYCLGRTKIGSPRHPLYVPYL